MTGNGTAAPRLLSGADVLPPMKEAAPRPTRPARASKAKGPARLRFALLNAFVDFTLAGLGRAEIAVWLILYRDSRDGIARTGQTDIARRAGVDRRTVYRALRRLEGRGLVQTVYAGGLGRGLSRYRVRPLAGNAGRGT